MRGNRIPQRIGYLAAGLILAHAALSYYWAAGGMGGLGLLSEGIQAEAEARPAWFVGLLWGVAILKTFVGGIAIGLARQWTFPVPHWMPLLVAWGAGVVLTVYALVQIAGLTIGGFIVGTDDDLTTAFWAYLLLWAPLWLAIGIAYLLTAWQATASMRNPLQSR